MKYRHLCIVAMVIPGLFLSAGSHIAARNITDQVGRTVSLPDDPQRVVSLAPSITEIIFALGQKDRLKGVTTYSDFPDEAAKLPKVGSYVHLDLERIVALKPDMCIAIKDGNPKAVVKQLASLKIPVYAVNPKNLDALMQTILEIGNLLNACDNANTLVQDMRSRIQQVKSQVAQTTCKPGVFFQIGISPIVSAGTNTFANELIEISGGQNLAKGPVTYPRFSQEQVLALCPEVFIISSMSKGEAFDSVKAQWSRWTDLPAVRNHRIYLVDSNLFDRPTPRLVDALELLLKLIHPELPNDKRG
jgi:iron complex transport system substrate-binding protein